MPESNQEPTQQEAAIADVAIIGAGPSGLTAGLYAARAGYTVALLERLAPGGQAATTWRVDNYPGVPQVNGAELVQKMADQALGFGVVLRSEDVTRIEPGPMHRIVTSSGSLQVRAVILASGASHRHLQIPGEEKLQGRGVSYCATCDGAFFRNMPVAVIGGGNTALEESEFLTRFASKIYLVHRRNEFRADKILTDQILHHPKIEVVTPFVPTDILGESEVTGLKLAERGGTACRDLEVKGVFVFIGSQPNTAFLDGTVALDQQGYILTSPDLSTNRPGIFAAGDCRSGSVKQIITAAAEGATAAVMVDRYLQAQRA